MKIQEGRLVFDFKTDDESCATQYDEWSFYRKQFIGVTSGTKAVDFIYVDKTQSITWLIEVKDYRHADTQPIKPSELSTAVAQKVRDSLAGLAVARCNANDLAEREFSQDALSTSRLRVVLHMEQTQPSHRFINPADMRLKLKQQLKAVDAHPEVVNQYKLKDNMRWNVAG